MVRKVTLPNVKQPLTSEGGYVTKAWADFFRDGWERSGGNQDAIANIEDEINAADQLIFRNRIEELEKRLRDLEKQVDSIGI